MTLRVELKTQNLTKVDTNSYTFESGIATSAINARRMIEREVNRKCTIKPRDKNADWGSNTEWQMAFVA